MRTLKILLSALLVFSYSALSAQPEEMSATQPDFIPDFSADSDMSPVKASKSDLTLSYGAFITSMILDDTKKNDMTDYELMSSLTIARIWLRTTIYNNLGFYVRAKDTYLKVLEDSSEDTDAAVDDDNQIELDAGYLSYITDNKMFEINLGRKLFHIGTGIAFSGTGDGGEINFYSSIIDMQIFGAYTGFLNKDTNPYRLSDRDIDDGAKRIFYGGKASYTIENQQLYLLAVNQTDNGDDFSETFKTTYNSLYYGAGLEGVFMNAAYYAEYIIEQGESYTTDLSDPASPAAEEKGDIKASAGNFGLNYYFDIPMKPVILLNYAFGSGDGDRVSPRTPNGNTAGNDEGFMYFGKYVGGYALRPYLSNIHIYRAGLSFSPTSMLSMKQLNRMVIIARYSYYKKDVSSSGISDPYAILPRTFIGEGIDVSLRWKVYYDLSIFANYAQFMPGDAYPDDQENHTFVMAGINLML